MDQLESDQALAVLGDVSTRRLVVTLIETGLRLGDACLLDFDCVMVDSAGWPCLGYHDSKITSLPDLPRFSDHPGVPAVHRAQAATNRTLIARAEADGRFRLVTNLRRTQDSLDAIIPALEALQGKGETDAS